MFVSLRWTWRDSVYTGERRNRPDKYFGHLEYNQRDGLIKRVVEGKRVRRREETRLKTRIIITDECLAQLGTNCVTVKFDYSVDKADIDSF